LARRLYPNGEGKQKAWMKAHQKRLLDQGKIEKPVGVLPAIKSSNAEVAEKIRTETDYFARNAERMRYPKFRRQHLFLGSPASLKPDAKPSSLPVSNAPVCSGPSAEPTPSLPSAAPFSMAASRITARVAARRPHNSNFYVALPVVVQSDVARASEAVKKSKQNP